MNKIYAIIALLTLTLVGCDDFLDKEPLNDYSVATVFQTEQDVKYALNGLYRQIRGFNTSTGNPSKSEYVYSLYTDDGYNRSGASKSSDLDFSASKSAVSDEYSSRYTVIRDVNEFLARAPQAKENFSDENLYNRYIAEARFIRAINYARLNFLFGAVPLLTEPTDPDFFPKRATRLKVFDFVATELTEIANDLPEQYTEPGDEVRITRGAALAIKARHLLNGLDWHANTAELYTEAAASAGDVYAKGIYSLDMGASGFHKLFTRESANGASNGAILTVNYDRDFKAHGYQNAILPKGAFSGTKKNNSNYAGISNNLVEAFQVKSSGLDVHDSNSGYDPANPWEDRDPRLDITALRAGEVIPIKGGDGVNDLYVYDAHPKKDPTVTLSDGRVIGSIKTDDVNKNAINKTGYHFQKYQDFDFEHPTSGGDIQYHFIRFAEVVLLYAEAVLGKDDNINLAMSLVDEVRARVDMPGVATSYGAVTSTEQALEIILKERRFEFACEGPQRFFDIRRHRLGEEVFAEGTVYGIPLGENRTAQASVLEGDLDDGKKIIVGTQNFNPATYYLWPLPQGAIDDNPNLAEDPE
ncbi:RagB/SusD family nutrient uptake outer membrane protein [Puteibacter caeruleilacunae]|nr:RagB/SusD family nutrient uptake outer membrane protein [Puteibacter caeruleilacunae]